MRKQLTLKSETLFKSNNYYYYCYCMASKRLQNDATVRTGYVYVNCFFFSFLVMEMFALHVKCSNNLKQIMYGLKA